MDALARAQSGQAHRSFGQGPARVPRRGSAGGMQPWRDARLDWLVRGLIALAAGVCAIAWVQMAMAQRGDYDLHWKFAANFIEHRPLYVREPNRFHPYPPFWAVFHAPVAVFPMRASQVVIYPLGVASMMALFALLWRMVCEWVGRTREARVAIVTVSAVLAGRYLLRDLPEVGVNTFLVLLTWLGIWLWMKGRDWLGGTSLALAVSLKCTPALFVLYFAWKRQWKMVLSTATMTALFTLSPMLWMGPTLYVQETTYWLERVLAVARQADPSLGVLGEDALINMSLRPRLARYLMHLPPGHNLRPPHGHVELLTLAPATAGMVVRGVMVGLLVLAGWCYRQRVVTRREPHVLWECAGISLLALLLSPTTWSQHAVGVLPGCFLLAATLVTGRPRWWVTMIAAYWIVAVLVLNRALFGRSGTILFDSYGLETWAMVALLGLTFAAAARGGKRCLSISGERAMRNGDDNDVKDYPRFASAVPALKRSLSVRPHVRTQEVSMSETVIGLFPETQQAEEVVPMLANRGYGRADVDVIGGRGSSLSGSGSDLLDKLSQLGLADEEQKEAFVDGIGRGGAVIAARTADEKKADQIAELMRDHGATQCMHMPDTGWSTA